MLYFINHEMAFPLLAWMWSWLEKLGIIPVLATLGHLRGLHARAWCKPESLDNCTSVDDDDLTGITINLGLELLPRPSDSLFVVRKEYVSLLLLLETESVILRGCVIFGNWNRYESSWFTILWLMNS